VALRRRTGLNMFRGYHYTYGKFNSSGIFYTVPWLCLELFTQLRYLCLPAL